MIDQLKTIPPAISKLSIDNKLVLGTVQFGMHYGINNISGQPSSNEVKSIIKTAIDSGVKFIDTARNYGNSENLLGRFMTYEDRNKGYLIFHPLYFFVHYHLLCLTGLIGLCNNHFQ